MELTPGSRLFISREHLPGCHNVGGGIAAVGSMGKQSHRFNLVLGAALLVGLIAAPVQAHDPVFGIGPHVLYKGGIEVASEVDTGKKGNQRETELGLELTYGLTGDWAAGVDLPYRFSKGGSEDASGTADVSVFTKYRFWRFDTLGAQESAAILAKVKFANGDEDKTPPVGSGSTDAILGLSYGYESRKWYRWASVRYRRNGENDDRLRRGDKLLVDLVGGIRPKPTGYLRPDTVWLLELNAEYGQRAEFRGSSLPNTGGKELFVSPGIFWTLRNFAVKAGVQIPVASNLHGNQNNSDYRARLILEWHL
ncbi:secreted protein [hydrothermal vent metagenome]|uniref:Secreted protein n=1 Tax=hydrothermal vent metagenome TaxID=652676 RepID=A0A3B0Y0K6_9ZZZZ